MAKIALLCMVLMSVVSQAQSVRMSDFKVRSPVIRIKDEIPQQRYLNRPIPVLALPSPGNQNLNTTYWQGFSYTAFSINGRFRSTHSFDVAGNLMDSKASINLRKNGPLSFWRIQFSGQRSRPLFVYTIH